MIYHHGRIATTFIALFLSTLWKFPAYAQTNHSDKELRRRGDADHAWLMTRQLFQHELDRDILIDDKHLSIPGGALAIVIDGRLRYAGGMGTRRIDSSEIFTANTLITVASITKMVTATTVMSLVQDGKIDLDRPINAYLEPKGYRLSRRVQDQHLADAITMRHLLEHTAGLPDELPSGVGGEGTVACKVDADAFRSYLELHAHDPLLSNPGALWNYSNAGYFAVAAVIEAVTGHSFETEARERVLIPTGMATAEWDGTTAKNRHLFAHGYEYRDHRLKSFTPASTPCRVFLAAAGLKASVIDFAHFAETFMAHDNGWLTKKSIMTLETPLIHTFDRNWDYSYGFFVNPDYKGVKVIAHDGVAWGYRTVVLMIPSRRFAFIAFHNVGLSLPERLWHQAFKAADRFLDLTTNESVKPVINARSLTDLVGEYRGITYDYDHHTEAHPQFMELSTRITLDPITHQLKWEDERWGKADFSSTWWPAFKVSYPDIRRNMSVHFIRDAMGVVTTLVSREYVARRMSTSNQPKTDEDLSLDPAS